MRVTLHVYILSLTPCISISVYSQLRHWVVIDSGVNKIVFDGHIFVALGVIVALKTTNVDFAAFVRARLPARIVVYQSSLEYFHSKVISCCCQVGTDEILWSYSTLFVGWS